MAEPAGKGGPGAEVLNEMRTIAGVTKSIGYGYNKDGTLNAIAYPSSFGVTYGYDTAGRPGWVEDATYLYASSAVYAPQGAISSVSLNSNPETFSYDKRLRVTGINVNSGNTLNLAYGYLGNGDMSTVTNNRDTGRNETFGYDQLNRLTSAQSQATSGADCWGQSIPSTGYDRYGNLLTINSTQCSSPTLSLTVSTKNRLTNTGFTYDNAGNLTFDGLYNYTWDAENHLKSANGVNYTYDGDLRRVKKSNGKLYWYSGGQILEETDLSGNVISDYVYFAGRRVGRRDASGTVYSYVTDPLGTTKGIISASTLCYDADFYPFGGEKVFTNNCAQNYKFTGLELHAESGLDDTLFRKYSSNLGRWLSPDPLGGNIFNPQSLNRYAYVINNPCSLTDPFGTSPCSFTIKISDPNNSLGSSLTAVEAQIAAVFAQSYANLGVAFTTSGGADFTLDVTNLKVLSPTYGSWSGGTTGYLYVNSAEHYYPASWTTVLGNSAAHELGHGLGSESSQGTLFNPGPGAPACGPGCMDLSDLPFNPKDPNIMNLGNNQAQQGALIQASGPSLPAGILFNGPQTDALFGVCTKLHPYTRGIGQRHPRVAEMPAILDWGWDSFSFFDVGVSGGGNDNGDVGPGSGWCPVDVCGPPPPLGPRPTS